jgi:hypothetical protein
MANKVVYTALFGDYDDLLDPTEVSEGWDYVVLTDQDIKSDIWQVRKVKADGDPQRMARKVKVKWHEFIEHDLSLWLDCSFHIRCDLNKFWDERYVEPFAVPRHPIRECIYREIESCIVNRRGDESQLIKQREEYKALGVPPFNGIITSGVMMRRNCDFTREFCDDWWAEIEKQSVRDQVAFAKVAWEWGWQYHTYKWDYSQSKELKYLKHKKYR